jgi:putative lipoprotein
MTARESLLAVLCLSLCLSLFAPLSARGEAPEIPSGDDWFGQDKALHYGVSAGLAGAGYAGGAFLFDAPEARWLTGAGVALGAGVAKELYDAGRGSFFSFKDLAWDGLGTATGLALSWAVDRLFFQRDDSARAGEGLVGMITPQEGGAGLAGGMRPTLALSLKAEGHPHGRLGDGRNAQVVLLLLGGW